MKRLILVALILMESIAPSSLEAAPKQRFRLLPPAPPRSASKPQLTAQLANLQLQRLVLLGQYRPASPEVRAIEREIAALQRQLRILRFPTSPHLLPPATRPPIQLLGH